MNIENLSYEELKQLAKNLMSENEKLRLQYEARQTINTMEKDYVGFDYSTLEGAYLEYNAQGNE